MSLCERFATDAVSTSQPDTCRLQFSLDNSSWTHCRSSLRIGPLVPGRHSLSLRCTSGTLVSPSVTHQWTVLSQSSYQLQVRSEWWWPVSPDKQHASPTLAYTWRVSSCNSDGVTLPPPPLRLSRLVACLWTHSACLLACLLVAGWACRGPAQPKSRFHGCQRPGGGGCPGQTVHCGHCSTGAIGGAPVCHPHTEQQRPVQGRMLGCLDG